MTNMKKTLGNILIYFMVAIILIFALFPLWWIANISFKTSEEALVIPPKLIYEPTLKNYKEVLFGVEREDNEGRWVPSTKGFMKPVGNSLVVSLTATFVAMLAGIPAAYALSKFKFKKKQNISFFVLSTRFVPPIVIVIPLFVAFRKLGLMDTKLGLGASVRVN